MLVSLALPIGLTAAALFFMSFLSWMVLGLHKDDWRKLAQEDEFMSAVRNLNIPVGSYMFPGCEHANEMNSPEYRQKWEAGPCGIMTVYPKVNMPRNLLLTFITFLVVTFCLAYLGTHALPAGSSFMNVFRFFATAAFLVYLTAFLQHAIWFHSRIVGHVIESIAYAAITGAIFGAMWPAAA